MLLFLCAVLAQASASEEEPKLIGYDENPRDQIIIPEALRVWWSVWGTRILVTVAILVLWEWRSDNGLLRSFYERNVSSKIQKKDEEELCDTYTPRERGDNSSFLSKLEAEAKAAYEAVEAEHAAKVKQGQEEKERKREEDFKSAGIDPSNHKPVGMSKSKLAKAKKVAKEKKAEEQAEQQQADKPLTFRAKTGKFPGMGGFHNWYDVETSLYRIYTLGRNDGEPVVPPYIPHSYRGNVSLFLHVTNDTDLPIRVFWVGYKGQHVDKGELMPGQTWTQTTYIDHPWVFEHAHTQAPLLYFIPYRAIPTLPAVPTMTEEGIGRHQFRLKPTNDADSPFWLSVEDEVMPFSADYQEIFPESLPAVTWTLQHMSRDRRTTDMFCVDDGASALDTLRAYLNNIAAHPEVAKYRRLRLSSPRVAPIWMSAARGLLLAVGFVEVEGHIELGCAEEPLSREWVQGIALLSYLVQRWQKEEREGASTDQQPQGADGYGRAGFGRAGTIN